MMESPFVWDSSGNKITGDSAENVKNCTMLARKLHSLDFGSFSAVNLALGTLSNK